MLKLIIDWLVYSVLKLNPEKGMGALVNFFIYDSAKILGLLFLMISLIGFIRTFLPYAKVRSWLAGKGFYANIIAALFGAITPFCSCSGVPIFIGFLKVGVPLGAAFSFLITSPLVNEYLVVIMAGMFGWKIALLYALSGILIGIAGGFILGELKLEKYLEQDIACQDGSETGDENYEIFEKRIYAGVSEALSVVKKLWKWVLLAVAVGALIHNYVPGEAIQSVVGKLGSFSVPLAVLVGVPLYGSCSAIVPIAYVLFVKGIPLGTTLAFMMAISGLSLPEAVLLKKVLKLRLLLIFFSITAFGIVLIGYLFNYFEILLF